MRALWVALLTLAGCGAGQGRPGGVFDETQVGRSMAPLEQALRGAALQGVPVAVGASAGGLWGVPLEGGSPWRVQRPVDMRPEITGSVVIGVGGGELFAVRAATGSPLWSRPVGSFELVGAGDDGDVTVVTLSSLVGRGHLLLAVGRDGQVLRQLETDKPLGRPAVIRGIAFLPWKGQFLSALDTLQGRELARLGGDGLTSAFVERGSLFFGGVELARLDAQVALGSFDRMPRAEIPPTFALPRPSLTLPLREARLLDAGPLDRARAYAAPSHEGLVGLADGVFYVTHHRVVMAFHLDGEFPIWVRVMPSVSVGGSWFKGGLALCDEQGTVSLLDESTGEIETTLGLEHAPQSCVVQGGDLVRPGRGGTPEPLARQLAVVLRLREPEALGLQRGALALLGRLGDASTTELLLELHRDPSTPDTMLDPLARLIAARRNASAVMVQELQRMPDAQGTGRPPPVAAIAEALVAARESQAAPWLVAHLLHPASSGGSVRAAAAALLELATPAEIHGLRAFFARHRASDGAAREALLLVARTLVRLGGEGLRDVRAAAADLASSPGLRADLEALLPAR